MPVLAGRTKVASIVLHLSNNHNDIFSFYLHCGRSRVTYAVAASRGVGTDPRPRRLAALCQCLLVEQMVMAVVLKLSDEQRQCSFCVHAVSSFKTSMLLSFPWNEH